MILLLLFASVLFASSALGQSGTVLDLGGGSLLYNDSSGQSGRIIELGGIKTYHDSHGTAGSILNPSGGVQSPPLTTTTRSLPARPFTQRGQMGFDEKYECGYSIFNPINQYRPDNPTNPINPINGVAPNNPAATIPLRHSSR